MNYAVNFYDLRSNPCRKAGSMGKSKADERPYWTLEEFQKFSDAIMDKQDSWIAFQILFWTGMRIGELLALQVKDIDFEQGTITVDESLTRLDGEDLITAPKTESSVRVITIHKELQEEIKEYIATLYHVRPGTRLFAGRTKSFFEHEMERGIKLSGVKKITVHCTRHSHASMLVQMGFSPVEIAKRLGHGKVTTTIERIAESYTEEIMKKLTAHGYKEALVHLYIICGGGGCLLRHFSDLTEKGNVTVISDICANAKGYEALAEMKQRMRGKTA